FFQADDGIRDFHVTGVQTCALPILPTGIVVACQQERSQHKNRATAMNMLKARLYEQELQKREEAAMAEAASKTDIGWGHQIRSRSEERRVGKECMRRWMPAGERRQW